jgi:hypothetical protein
VKAAIYVNKKPTDGLQEQVGHAYALIDQKGWEMSRMIHQDELADENKLDQFLQAVKSGDFQALALPSLDVFPIQVLDALTGFGVELAVYDPAAVERAKHGNEVLERQAARKGEKAARAQAASAPPDYEKLANEPWKAALLSAFIKKE